VLQAATKEGFLMKQTWSFQRWRRRYFKLKGRKLYYAKDTKVRSVPEIPMCVTLVFLYLAGVLLQEQDTCKIIAFCVKHFLVWKM
jgi:hypothetical protein